MKLMSDYVAKLEGFPDLEVSIIRSTKINKVLKAILKLDNIPKDDEYKLKSRSQVLLDKWNKLLAVDGTPTPAAEVNGASKGAAKANGVKSSEGSEPAKDKDEAKDEAKEEAAGKETPKEASEEESKEAPKEAAKPEEASEAAEKPAAEEVRPYPPVNCPSGLR
jgi:hypothetical protein